MLAGMTEEILSERLPHDFEAFREYRPRAFRTPRVRRGVEGHHLVGLARAPESYLQAAPQHLVEQRDVLRHAQGVPEREDHHRGAEADARGAAAQIRRDQERIRQIVPPVRPEVVLGEPERVEARLLAEQGLLPGVVEKLRVALRESRILEGGVEDESHYGVLPDWDDPEKQGAPRSGFTQPCRRKRSGHCRQECDVQERLYVNILVCDMQVTCPALRSSRHRSRSPRCRRAPGKARSGHHPALPRGARARQGTAFRRLPEKRDPPR